MSLFKKEERSLRGFWMLLGHTSIRRKRGGAAVGSGQVK